MTSILFVTSIILFIKCEDKLSNSNKFKNEKSLSTFLENNDYLDYYRFNNKLHSKKSTETEINSNLNSNRKEKFNMKTIASSFSKNQVLFENKNNDDVER